MKLKVLFVDLISGQDSGIDNNLEIDRSSVNELLNELLDDNRISVLKLLDLDINLLKSYLTNKDYSLRVCAALTILDRRFKYLNLSMYVTG